jgi:hypothetical protein
MGGGREFSMIPVKVTWMSSGWITSFATLPIFQNCVSDTDLNRNLCGHTFVFIEIQFFMS